MGEEASESDQFFTFQLTDTTKRNKTKRQSSFSGRDYNQLPKFNNVTGNHNIPKVLGNKNMDSEQTNTMKRFSHGLNNNRSVPHTSDAEKY